MIKEVIFVMFDFYFFKYYLVKIGCFWEKLNILFIMILLSIYYYNDNILVGFGRYIW